MMPFETANVITKTVKKIYFVTGAAHVININEIPTLHHAIMLTSPCNVDTFTPHFYIVNFGFTGVYIILLFNLKHRMWVLVRTASMF